MNIVAIVAEKNLPTETRQLVAHLRREIGPILAPRPVLLAYL
jgi:hypothetical protein